ncbi:MAG TPA: zf-HC2 domain-containing protein [Opitutaceae bacterium]|nr:zf-HC2 domain-containing protein [Opitutaceae bacterium]
MDCNETRRLLDADIDGELDLVRHLELEAHLRACPGCARLAENARARGAALRESLPRFTAPPQLAEKIRAALPAPPAAPVAVEPRPAKTYFPIWQVTGLAASLAFAVLVGFRWGDARAHANLLVDEAIADHVRSLQASHLTDVASTDQHTVKPWFAGKLDFSPPVVDLATAGFPLAGGRLEHLDGRPAAALVFHRRQHAINLFIWPADTGIGSTRAGRNGYNTETWSEARLNFLAVSEIPPAELAEFARIFRANQR